MKIFKFAAIGALLYLFSGSLQAQEIKTAGYRQPEVEVGVVEHLGDTIPLDLWFYNENSEQVTLRSLIDRPTIMSFVYFDCPNLCSPLMDGIAEVVSKMDMSLGTDYKIITISFNTSDTPEKAREKKVNFVQRISKENQKDWIYLTGTQENISAITPVNTPSHAWKARLRRCPVRRPTSDFAPHFATANRRNQRIRADLRRDLLKLRIT